jgi:hypothetical protein
MPRSTGAMQTKPQWFICPLQIRAEINQKGQGTIEKPAALCCWFFIILNCDELFITVIGMKPGPKKRVYERITVSLAKGQKGQLERLANGETSVADLIRRAVNDAYGKSNRSKSASL